MDEWRARVKRIVDGPRKNHCAAELPVINGSDGEGGLTTSRNATNSTNTCGTVANGVSDVVVGTGGLAGDRHGP